MLLARGLQHQGQAFCQGLKRKLEVDKKLAEENEATRKTAEEQAEKMHQEFDDYQRQKRDERKKVVAGA